MNSLLANWKTTTAGLLAVAIGLASLLGISVAGMAPVDPATAITMITAGAGLVFAKDGNVTGGTKTQ
jgi:hypothetical protein